MGSGKTAVGRWLSEKYGWPFFDTDFLIQQKAKKSISEIFESLKEEGFRALEHEVIRVLANVDKSIIATGGGALLDPTNEEILRKNGYLVWLKIKPETAFKRIPDPKTRPLLNRPDSKSFLPLLMTQREPVYKRCHAAIDVDELTIQQAADKVLESFKKAHP